VTSRHCLWLLLVTCHSSLVTAVMNLVFCGTPQFAVPTLQALIREGFTIPLVLTNRDEPSGRGYERRPSPVKRVAEEHGLVVLHPARLRDRFTQGFLSGFQPDVIAVVAYGHIFPPWMIDLPRLGCVNLHASLLPKYRGAAPIPWAIVEGERITGVSTMKMDPGLDTGDVLLQRQIEIADEDTTETLSERMSALGARLMVETLDALDRAEITPRPQDHNLATRAPLLKKEDGQIDWSLTAEEIARRVRGLRPWPGAYTRFRDKTLHLWAANAVQARPGSAIDPGVAVAEGGRLLVGCGHGTVLEIREAQLADRKRMSASAFLNGVRLAAPEKLGP
jgi:methionyl-tRNA formyltransferase